MLENEQALKDQKERKRTLWGLAAIAAFALILLVVMIIGTQNSKSSAIEGVLRAGTAEFDGYRNKVQIEMIETIVHPNLIGMAQHEVRARVTNLGDRSLTAVEVRGKMLGLDDGIVADAIGFPIPRTREKALAPGESLSFSIKIDRPGNIKEEQIKDHALELRGIRF